MRASPLERFALVLVAAYPVALTVFGIRVFTTHAEWRHPPPSYWRTATDLEHGLMASEFSSTHALVGRTRAAVIADLGEPKSVRKENDGRITLLYDAGPDNSSPGYRLQEFQLGLDPDGRVAWTGY